MNIGPRYEVHEDVSATMHIRTHRRAIGRKVFLFVWVKFSATGRVTVSVTEIVTDLVERKHLAFG